MPTNQIKPITGFVIIPVAEQFEELGQYFIWLKVADVKVLRFIKVGGYYCSSYYAATKLMAKSS